ncbi:calcium-binding protein [Jannaschia aquimarina]|uniref:AlgE7 protein n=1 Tax=Jannaschia aquimarina TaxID=935700 RepID=A0A0D1EHI0_9RHOB|nr:hypothetical protein [Jannaschia aquimarina]KIT16301.1 Poly(beta-D-mannuronate) C5 epimerase 7 [Jannaschia aquimarina]SNT26601.1 Hemolysin-type calcium-binding repeat-containing protein [Jannaschia aquimarina]
MSAIIGTDGPDDLVAGLGGDTVDGGAGDDTIHGSSESDLLIGGDGNDSVAGGHGSDKIEGGAGDDTLDGDAGQDRIRGGEGNDLLLGATGSERPNEDGEETLPSADRLQGGDGEDTLIGGNGDDILFGDSTAGGRTKYSDTYVFDNDDGNDEVVRFDDGTSEDGVQDVLVFVGAAEADVMVAQVGKHTILTYGDTTVKLRGQDADEITFLGFNADGDATFG